MISEMDREETLLTRLVMIQEEMALEVVLATLEAHDRDPTVSLLAIRPDESQVRWLERERKAKTRNEFNWWLENDPEAWRAVVQANGMARSCRAEMEKLLHYHKNRNYAFYRDAVATLKLEDESASEAELHNRALSWCLRIGVRPPKWDNKSHCEHCGTMPSPKAGGGCQWCNTFEDLHDKKLRTATSRIKPPTKDRDESPRNPEAQAGAGEVASQK